MANTIEEMKARAAKRTALVAKYAATSKNTLQRDDIEAAIIANPWSTTHWSEPRQQFVKYGNAQLANDLTAEAIENENPWKPEHFHLTRQLLIINENPALAHEMQIAAGVTVRS